MISINPKSLSNKEKAKVIGALKYKYKTVVLLDYFQMARSSYFYQVRALKFSDKYVNLRIAVNRVFEESSQTYGYRRIHAALVKEGIKVSEKVIRRIMSENGISVSQVIKKKYSSYKGEISPAVENVINRKFTADNPNEKWLTDITEFHLPVGKVYLSPIIDCFDGMVVSWSVSSSPNAELVNSTLDEAISTLKSSEHPIVHTDRGCHYRWPGWIARLNESGLIRSMSAKGCSPDNAACEGFFGRLKNEMYYGKSWLKTSKNEFIHQINRYIEWYNEKRIKISLGAMSPLEYRRSLGLL